MRRLSLLICVIIVMLCAGQAWAKKPKEFTNNFFAEVKAGKISQAFDGLFQGSGISESKPQAVDMLKRQTSSGLPIYGDILDFELLYEEAFGTSIVRLVYILKQDKAPTIWQFYFYKPKDKWFLGHVIFNDQFQLIEKMN
ncbi:MAG TPA: hypothetical protein ENH23_05005 [candidate division Zixibacteria bacterium]|nr:hypothetical protein [candidate division Zixibacteria bacterium]